LIHSFVWFHYIPLIPWFIHSLIHSFVWFHYIPLIPWFIHSFDSITFHSFLDSFIHWFIHSLIHSFIPFHYIPWFIDSYITYIHSILFHSCTHSLSFIHSIALIHSSMACTTRVHNAKRFQQPTVWVVLSQSVWFQIILYNLEPRDRNTSICVICPNKGQHEVKKKLK